MELISIDGRLKYLLNNIALVNLSFHQGALFLPVVITFARYAGVSRPMSLNVLRTGLDLQLNLDMLQMVTNIAKFVILNFEYRPYEAYSGRLSCKIGRKTKNKM